MAIYDPKSLKAEEFINDAEIRETIKYAEANKHNVELIDSLLKKAKPQKTENGVVCHGLNHREASVLLAEQGKDLPNMVWLETLSNVIIDMLDYQRDDLKSEAEKIYDIYYGRVSANNE